MVAPPQTPTPGGDAGAAAQPWNEGAGLGIQERRSWATWQLSVAAFIFLIVGMMLGYSGKKPPKLSTASSAISSQTRTSPSTTSGPTISVGTPPNDGATATTSTTAAASTAEQGPQVLIVPKTSGSGPTSLPSFATGGTWSIGWAYSCVLAPGGSGPFSINVVPDAGGGAASIAVQETNRSGQGVTPVSAAGHQHLQVLTDPACRWAIKVVGVAG